MKRAFKLPRLVALIAGIACSTTAWSDDYWFWYPSGHNTWTWDSWLSTTYNYSHLVQSRGGGDTIHFDVANGQIDYRSASQPAISGLTFESTGNRLYGNAMDVSNPYGPFKLAAPVAGSTSTIDLDFSGGTGGFGGWTFIKKVGPGTIIYNGNITGAASLELSEGIFELNNQALYVVSHRLYGGRLRGNGSLPNAWTVAYNQSEISPGGDGTTGTLSFGRLESQSGSIYKIDLANSLSSDRIAVAGEFRNYGAEVDVNAPTNLATGTYTFLTYGTLTRYAGITIKSVPAGFNPNHFSIIESPGSFSVVYARWGTFWDGNSTPRNNGVVDGGSGTWSANNTDGSWTQSAGNGNAAWEQNGTANFGGASGTVSVDTSAGAINIGGLKFTTTGYTISGGTLTGTAATTTLDAATGVSATIASELSGSTALVKSGAGTITLSGNNSYTGQTSVSAGTMWVNGTTSSNQITTVSNGATLGGSGTIGNEVQVANGGTLAPGSANNTVGSLTVNRLSIDVNGGLAFDLNTPSSADTIQVNGDVTLQGTVNVTGTMARGIYRLITYTGTKFGTTIAVGTLPSGVSASDVAIVVDTTAKTVDLVYAGSGTYWDAAGARNNNAIDGGSGTWTAATSDTSWGISSGSFNGAWEQNGTANFGGTAGTVTVDTSAGAINIGGLSFTTTGYTLTGGTLTGSSGGNTLTAGSGIAATIDSVLAGTGSYTKAGAGTITLSRNATYSGGTTISAGTLAITASSNTLPSTSTLSMTSGSTLDMTDVSQTVATLAGAGTVALGTSGSLTVTGTSTFTGSFTGTGKLTLPTGANLTLQAGSQAQGLEIVLNGGTLTLPTGSNLSFRKLTVSAASTIALGNTIATFTADTLDITAPGTSTALTINGWTNGGFHHVYAPTFNGGVDMRSGSAPENRIEFNGFPANDTNWNSGTREIKPIVTVRTIRGKVFKDNGAGSGIANDGVLNGSEVGWSGANVVLTNCASTTYSATVSDSSGVYSILAPTSIAYGSAVCIETSYPTSGLDTGASVGSTAIPPTGSITVGGESYSGPSGNARVRLTWSNSSRSDLNLGVIGATFIDRSSALMVLPGGSALHAHRVIPTSTGTISIAISSTSSTPISTWIEALYRDNNCNGVIDTPADGPMPSSITVTSAMIDKPICFLARVQPPAGAQQGDFEITIISANASYVGPVVTVADLAVTTLTTTVDSSSGVTIIKGVCNVSTSAGACTTASDFTLWNEAKPGEDLVYRTVYTNNTSQPISQFVISEQTPNYTSFVRAWADTLPAGVTGCQMTTPAGTANCSVVQTPGGTGLVRWTFTGNLASGQSSAVLLRVKVNP